MQSILTIPSPNTDRSLLTLAELRSAVGVTDNSQDAELTTLGDYISAIITRACKVPTSGAIPPTLRLETVVETFRVPYDEYYSPLYLSRKPVVAITTVTEAGSSLIASQYEVDGDALHRLSGDARIGWGVGTHVVTYSAGWDTVPDDLKFAAIRMVQAEWSTGGVESSRDPMLKRELIVGVREREYWVDPTMTESQSSLPPDVKDMLDVGGYIYKWTWMR